MKKVIAGAVAGVVVVAIVVYLAVAAMPYKQLSAVSFDSTTGTTARQKLDAIKSVEYSPAQHHKPATDTETFTDAELSWLAAWRAQRSNLPFDGIIVHCHDGGVIESQVNAHIGLFTFPIYSMAKVVAGGGNQVQVDVLQSRFGRWDLGGPLVGGVEQAFKDMLNLSVDHTRNYDSIQLTVSEGQLTVSVLANPK